MPPETCLLCLIVLAAVSALAWRWRVQRDGAIRERDVAVAQCRRWHQDWREERQRAVAAELRAEEWHVAWSGAQAVRMRDGRRVGVN